MNFSRLIAMTLLVGVPVLFLLDRSSAQSTCPGILNCLHQNCSKTGDATCHQCKGVVIDTRGYRAYKMTSDRKLCQQACSWRDDSNRCYPGNCNDELISSCVCSPGFSGTHCRHLTKGPDIIFNELKIESQNKLPSDFTAGPIGTQDDVWTNHVTPAVLTFEVHSKFVSTMPEFHSYIEGARVGLVGVNANFVLTNKNGIQKGTLTRTCDGLSDSEPYTNIFACKEELENSVIGLRLPLPFQHEEKLDVTINSIAGGFVIVKNKETNTRKTDYFVSNTTTHAFQMRFDIVDPYHCLSGCSDKMLNIPQNIIMADVTMSWRGWADDAAGIGQCGYRAYVLTPVNNVLQHGSLDTSGFVNTTAGAGTVTLHLTSGPGIYAILLDAYDRAGNVKSARRIVLYDSSSEITRNPDATAPLRVTSASPVTSWAWQITEGDVTVTWTGRYTNVFHDHNKLLNAVKAEGDVEKSYDDNEGNVTVNATEHVLGIVKFTTAYLINKQGGSTLKVPPDSSFSHELGLTGTNTYPAGTVDGDTLTLWVRAYDIRGVYDEEAVTVHVDSSPPVITNLWLTKGHILNVSVHGVNELDKMTMEWEAYDPQSGLREVAWRVFDNITNTDIVHGHEFVQNQGQFNNLTHCQNEYAAYIRGPQCYCTGPVQCFHRHFQVQPLLIDGSVKSHSGIFQDNNVHDHDYFLEVTVYNHANLTTTLRTKITVDLSPPHPGAVHDGTAGSPEVDYTSSTSLAAHWSGFFDRESGVKYYQYAFDTACGDAAAFSHVITDARVHETYDTFASWTAPGDGDYTVTVVAYNSFRMPSQPICSDGVRVDSTPPSMAAFYVQRAIVAGGVVPGSNPEEVWFIGSDRRRRLVKSPDSTCVSAARAVTLTLADFAVSPLTSPMNATEACGHGALDTKFIDTFYLTRDKHLFVNWTGSDADSGIYDYEVGLASSSSAGVPDVSGYESTRQHSEYRRHHPTLSEGTPFYILVKAINRAGLETVKALGPVALVRTPPTYTGIVTLTLTSGVFLVAWDTSLLADVEKQLLTFTVSMEDQTSGFLLHPHTSPSSSPTSSAPCPAATPPACATIDLAALNWGLREQHVYVAKVKVTSLLGLDLQLTSDPYTHDTRVAAAGSVLEVVPVTIFVTIIVLTITLWR